MFPVFCFVFLGKIHTQMGRHPKDIRPDEPERLEKLRRNYWAKMKSTLESKVFTSPEHLWGLACDYFAKAETDYVTKIELIKSGMFAGAPAEYNVGVPFSWAAFGNYLVSRGYRVGIYKYRVNYNGDYETFVDVIERINDVIHERNFNGATVGVFNASLVSKQLNLEDTTTINLNTTDKEGIDYSKLSEATLEELARQAQFKK